MTQRSRKFLAWGAAIAVLMAVFALYTRPDFMVDMANQVWACFQATGVATLVGNVGTGATPVTGFSLLP